MSRFRRDPSRVDHDELLDESSESLSIEVRKRDSGRALQEGKAITRSAVSLVENDELEKRTLFMRAMFCSKKGDQ